MSELQMNIKQDLGDKIIISPSVKSNRNLRIQPGDLSIVAPYGSGVYGYQAKKESNPFKNAPPQEACGGTIYFENNIKIDDLEALMRISGVPSASDSDRPNDFAVYIDESSQPGSDGYIAQLRIVSRFGLRFMFDALNDCEYNNFPNQELSITEVIWSFIKYEDSRWGTSWARPNKLIGLFGGDGDNAFEALSFGFMIENSYFDIYRIWSRAWLVTK